MVFGLSFQLAIASDRSCFSVSSKCERSSNVTQACGFSDCACERKRETAVLSDSSKHTHSGLGRECLIGDASTAEIKARSTAEVELTTIHPSFANAGTLITIVARTIRNMV